MIIVDTGILVAVANRADRWHQRATALLRARRHEMIVPAPVIVESAWLIHRGRWSHGSRDDVDSSERAARRALRIRAECHRPPGRPPSSTEVTPGLRGRGRPLRRYEPEKTTLTFLCVRSSITEREPIGLRSLTVVSPAHALLSP